MRKQRLLEQWTGSNLLLMLTTYPSSDRMPDEYLQS
jgi:hypothetical protein